MDTIAKVASLAMDFEEIVEMDINPLRAFHKGGVSALDVKITINPIGNNPRAFRIPLCKLIIKW